MKSIYIDDDLAAIRQAVREFVENEIVPNVEEWERAGEIPREILEHMGKLGFFGLRVPEEHLARDQRRRSGRGAGAGRRRQAGGEGEGGGEAKAGHGSSLGSSAVMPRRGRERPARVPISAGPYWEAGGLPCGALSAVTASVDALPREIEQRRPRPQSV